MPKTVWKYIVATFMLLALVLQAKAQRFFNLTAEEVRIDSVLPRFVYSVPLGEGYQDSVYTVRVKYPEYVEMTPTEIARYHSISDEQLPAEVTVAQQVSVSRRKGTLVVSFCPLVFRRHRYQILVSFMLDIQAKPLKSSVRRDGLATRAGASSATYVAHSVLSEGKWAKVRIPETGIYQLTESLIRQAGFSDIAKVKVYGYGGNLQPETLTSEYLFQNDDLQEVPQCVVGGNHLFYAKGSVSWDDNSSVRRTRNPYSDYGYYFLTQEDGDEPMVVDSSTFVSSFYPSPEFYHTLEEKDGYSWYTGGRNLFDVTEVNVGETKSYVLENPSSGTSGILSVALTAGSAATARVFCNDSLLGVQTVTIGSSYDHGGESVMTYRLDGLSAENVVSVVPQSGGPIRMDYVSMAWDLPAPCPLLTSQYPVPEYVCQVTNQDLHADEAADMVMVIPASLRLLEQAQRLKEYHEVHDGMRVSLVSAEELYNEFSSGTPDANAYRRYLRMLQDRAQTEDDMPKYLLLFGDCVWDNRMLTSSCASLSPEDYLLCYESENSFSETDCYVSDSWIGILAEGAGGNPRQEQQDVAVGRFPVTTPEEAKVMVDKVIGYMDNQQAGAWQNTLVFMGDDGNENVHMADENEVADYISDLYPGYLVKKVMWDAYTRETSSTGNTYPEVTSIIKRQQAAGALIMDYAGHGRQDQISHENVLVISDFENFRNDNLPLWITASCNVMPFDGVANTIGEAAVLNEKGGAVAFYGTTRTVYTTYNKFINRAFLRYVLSQKDGKPLPIGEAHRLAQNELVLGLDQTANHLQYSLLGDPAMPLNQPMLQIKIDSIGGKLLSDDIVHIGAGSVASIVGHVVDAPDFEGTVTATILDSQQLITCKLNDTSADGAEEAFSYYDRPNTLYRGSAEVKNGKFAFSFAIPLDVSYDDSGTGLVNLYAANADHTLSAQGYTEQLQVVGGDDMANDSIGPSIYCYLNSPSFVDGGKVNATPYFVAELTDQDGINAAGSGIGHDLQLVIDGDMSKTYVLNDNFTYDFGTYTSGSTYYSIPELEEGPHRLRFRAWDIKNNSSTVELNFNVVKSLSPQLFDVSVTENPASTSTTFIITHDRIESDMDVIIELFDTSGRKLWHHVEHDVPSQDTYTVNWDLTINDGQRLGMGLYIYRVKISSGGSQYVSKSRKLVVLNNN